MDHWEGALMSAHAGKIKASVGLGDSVYDRNKWTQFLVGAFLFFFSTEPQFTQGGCFASDLLLISMIARRRCQKRSTTAWISTHVCHGLR